MLEKKQSSSKYYTKENPSGPWSRALHEKRTGKPINEEEFKNTMKKVKEN